jgi:autotransporter-associated beta strand protein
MVSSFAKSLRRKFGTGRRAGPRVASLRSQLHVEGLEGRINPGTWTQINVAGNSGYQGAMLLSDGSVMLQSGQDAATKVWYRLFPDAQGNYVNGTLVTTGTNSIANSNLERLFFASNVLPNGKVINLGGEYSGPQTTNNWTNTGEIYDPVTNLWTNIPNFPQTQFGDDPSAVLPNGNVLFGYLSGQQTYIYNVASNSWSAAINKFRNDRSDEETWVLLPNNGGVLSYDIFTSPNSGAGTAEKFNTSTNTWQDAGSVPVPLTNSQTLGEELGPGLLLNDGRVFLVGANGNTVLYTPSTTGGTGTWAQGPSTLNQGADDAPGALLPNGHVMYMVDTPLFTKPTQIYDFNPSTNSLTLQTTSNTTFPTNLVNDMGSGSSGRAAFLFRMLALPNGHVLLTDSSTRMYDYTPDGSPVTTWAPTISSIAYNGGRTYTLTGTNLNGGSEGASYGDDAEMSSNYPLVRLTNGTSVFYARTFNWSTTGVQMGNTPATVQFTLPNNLPFANYQLSVVASGLSSVSSMSFTPPAYVDTRWVGLSNGTAVTDVDPVLSGNQSGTVGTGAYGTVAAAIAAVPAGGVVIVNGSTGGGTGSFGEAVVLNKQLNMLLQAGAVSFGSLAGTAASAIVSISGTGLTVGGDDTSTEFDGVLSGAGSLTKTGNGNFSVTGTNTYAGGTTISNGTLQIGVGGTAGSITGNVANGATLAFARTDNFSFSGSISGIGTTTNIGTATLGGAISGSQIVNQNSAGTLTLSVSNSYNGGTTVTAGTLKLGNAAALGSSTGVVQVNAAGTLDLNGFSPTIGSLALNGTLANTGGGSPSVTLSLISTYDLQLFSTSVIPAGLVFHFTSAILGGLNLNADAPLATLSGVTLDLGSTARAINVGSGGTWKLIDVPTTTNGYNLTGGGTLSIQGTTAVTNPAGVTVTAGTLDLAKPTGIAAVGGDVTVSGGTLHLSSNEQIPSSAAVTVNSGTFDLDGHVETIGSLAGTGGQVSLTSAATLTVGGTASTSYGGTVSGAGGLVLAGTTVLTLTGTNTYGSTGGTTISGSAVLSVAGDGNLGDPTAPLVFVGGGTLRATGAITSTRGITLNAGGGTVDTNGNSVTLSGPIAGAGGLTKIGAGTLTSAGTDTYAGTTSVVAGILLVNGSLTGPVSVGQNATLGGTGTVGNTTVDGILSPGNGVGVLTTGGTTIEATGTFSVNLNGPAAGTGYSQLVANAAVGLTGSALVVTLANGFTPGASDTFDILVNNSGADVTGTFNNLAEGDTFTANGQKFQITYKGGTSHHDVVLNAAPPVVTGLQVNDGSNQRSEVRSIKVSFSDIVTFAGGDATAAFTLQHVQTGTNVGLAATVGDDGLGHTTVTLTFSGNDTDPISVQGNANPVAGPSLVDGRYTLMIDGNAVTGSNAVKLDGAGNGTPGSPFVSAPDSVGGNGPRLYRLYGDVTGDGVNDPTDLNTFRLAFNTNNQNPGSGYLAFLDANNDGAIDPTDLNQYRMRFNTNVFG